MVNKTIVAVSKKGNVKKKKYKESKDKLIINLSDYFVLYKILETANSENQDFSRHPRLKVDFSSFFFLMPKGVLFSGFLYMKG